MYRGTFRAEKFVTNQIFLPFGQGGKSCRFLGETLLVDLSKLHATCSEKHCETRRFLQKKTLFWLCLLILNVETADFGKIFDKGVKTEFFVTSRTFWKKFLGKELQFYTFLCFFCGNVDFQVSRFIRKTFYVCISWVLNENLSVFWQNEFDRVARTAVHVIREALGIKRFFRKKNQNRIVFPRLSGRVLDSWQKYSQGESRP